VNKCAYSPRAILLGGVVALLASVSWSCSDLATGSPLAHARRTPEALARAAIELLGRPDDLARMGANGPARLEELGLTWEKSAAVFRDVYHQVLADQEA